MTEEQIKFLCKLFVENSNRPLTDFDKELLKQAIDNAKNYPEMISSIILILSTI
ncbi:MAG: hypothetical protein IJZ29_02210 [Clostridia bacterium]|nr:hypothetical protein [Clostridia bacterium]